VLGTGNTCLPACSHSLNMIPSKQFFQPQSNSPEVTSIWTISTCITNHQCVTIFKHFVNMNHYMVTRDFKTIVLRSSERDHLQISNSLGFQYIKYLIFTFLLSWREYISPCKMECIFLALCF
jgi:hypothetical protein